MSAEWDADTLVKIAAEAVQAHDWPMLEAAIKVLATVDPQKAQDLYGTIQAGLAGRKP